MLAGMIHVLPSGRVHPAIIDNRQRSERYFFINWALFPGIQDRKRNDEMVIRRILCLLFLFSFIIHVPGQLIPFDNYTIQNGLPQNTVNAVCQDREGYIWFATQLGAARYDGYEFDHFTTSNGLPDNFVNCLLADRQGHVWLGTEGGLAEYTGTGFTCYLAGDGLVNNRIDDLVEDGNGNIWAVTAYGISVITPDTILAYSKEDALTDNSVVTSFADSRGRVYSPPSRSPGSPYSRTPFLTRSSWRRT